MDDFTEQILDERAVYTGKVFTVVERNIQIAPDKTATWEVIKKRGDNSVAIVAVDDEHNVFLVEEYFGAINKRELSLPKGRIDDGEDAETAANRELQEEIGMRGNLTKLADVSVSPGYLTQITTLFLAQDLQTSQLQGDEEHHFAIRKMPLAQAIAMCQNGEISEARTITALLLAEKQLT